jgi:hypothetical protein
MVAANMTDGMDSLAFRRDYSLPPNVEAHRRSVSFDRETPFLCSLIARL